MRGILGLAAVVGCGEGGDGAPCARGGAAVEDPTIPAGGLSFALATVLGPATGTFSGAVTTEEGDEPLSLAVATLDDARVIYGDEACAEPAYQVGLRLSLDAAAAGIDAQAEVQALIPAPIVQLSVEDELPYGASGVSLDDPAMAGGGEDDVLITLSNRFDGQGWSGEVSWRFADGGFEPEGVLATWTAVR